MTAQGSGPTQIQETLMSEDLDPGGGCAGNSRFTKQRFVAEQPAGPVALHRRNGQMAQRPPPAGQPCTHASRKYNNTAVHGKSEECRWFRAFNVAPS